MRCWHILRTEGDIRSAQILLEECYHGEYDAEEDFAYYWTHEINDKEVTQFLRYYIDYKAMAHDLFVNDFFSVRANHKVHVFSHR